MVKKQQMRWGPRGAHLLLQIRTRVLNDTLTDDYQRWYPDFNHTHTPTGRTKPRSLPRFVPLSREGPTWSRSTGSGIQPPASSGCGPIRPSC